MALVVGTDTYISQSDATAYIEAHYASTSAQAVAWAALSSADKDAYLRKACVAIDRQVLVGIKSVADQVLEFPRALPTECWSDFLPNGYQRYLGTNLYVQTAVPDKVKYAQVEEALTLLVGVSARIDLQRQGVKSFSLGNLSETYGNYDAASLDSYDAQQLLREYVARSVPVG